MSVATKKEWLASLRAAFRDEDERQHQIAYLLRVGALLAIAWLLVGCAEDRWLTKEEDAEMRAACEPYGGCMLVPNPLWEQIKRALGLDDA